MKAKVLIEFRDKYSEEIKSVGDIIDVDQARAGEILSKGEYIELLPDEESKPKRKIKKTPNK